MTGAKTLADLKKPLTKGGKPDHRYKTAQVVKADNTRDLRTKLTAKR